MTTDYSKAKHAADTPAYRSKLQAVVYIDMLNATLHILPIEASYRR
jgi:hypothetical protein